MSSAINAKRGLLFCQVVSLAFLIVSCSKDEIPSVRIVTGGAGGSYLVAGRALARIVNANQASNGFQLENELSSG